jgi:hypothetical protein
MAAAKGSDGATIGPHAGGLQYAATYFLAPRRNPTTTARPPFTPPPPPRLALEHSPQGLAAQARTEPLVRAPPRRSEQLVAARTSAGKFFQSIGWALALALPLGGLLAGSLLRLAPLAHPPAIPTTLPAAALPPTFRLPPSPAGTPPPPSPGFLLTCRTAVPRLRMPGLKELLAAFEQTPPSSRRPTGALPRRRSSIMLKRAQGSCRSRRSRLGEGGGVVLSEMLAV